jgi:hypothetical protein
MNVCRMAYVVCRMDRMDATLVASVCRLCEANYLRGFAGGVERVLQAALKVAAWRRRRAPPCGLRG